MTVRLSRQMRDLLQTISSMYEAGVCGEDRVISFTTAQRKAMRKMRKAQKTSVDPEKLLSALEDYYNGEGTNVRPCL